MPWKTVEKNITSRGPHSFLVRIKRDGVDVTETFDTLAEARAFRDAKHASITLDPDRERVVRARAKKSAAAVGLTVGQALADYRDKITPQHKPSGAAAETTRLNKLRRYPLAELNLYRCNAGDVEAFLATLQREGAKPQTLNRYRSLLSKLFKVARNDWKLEVGNPAAGVSSAFKPAEPRPRRRRLSREELHYLIPACAKARNAHFSALVRFCCATAMRRGEAIEAITWGDVEIDTKSGIGLINLPHSKTQAASEHREIPLTTQAVAILLEIGPAKPEDPVFNLAKHNVRAAFDAAKRRARRAHTRDCKNAGKAPDPKFLANLRFHDLRAEGVTTMLEAGLTPAEVMEFSGHKTMHVFLGYTRFRKLELARKLSERNEEVKSGS